MKEIHRTEIVVTFRRVILISREESMESAEMQPAQTPFIVVNGSETELDPIDRRRVLREVLRILESCLDHDPT